MRGAAGKWQRIGFQTELLAVKILQALRDLNISSVRIGDEAEVQADLLGHVARRTVYRHAVIRKSFERSVDVRHVEADMIKRAALGSFVIRIDGQPGVKFTRVQ